MRRPARPDAKAAVHLPPASRDSFGSKVMTYFPADAPFLPTLRLSGFDCARVCGMIGTFLAGGAGVMCPGGSFGAKSAGGTVASGSVGSVPVSPAVSRNDSSV